MSSDVWRHYSVFFLYSKTFSILLISVIRTNFSTEGIQYWTINKTVVNKIPLFPVFLQLEANLPANGFYKDLRNIRRRPSVFFKHFFKDKFLETHFFGAKKLICYRFHPTEERRKQIIFWFGHSILRT